MSILWQNNPDGTTTFFDPSSPTGVSVGPSLALAVPVTPQYAAAVTSGLNLGQQIAAPVKAGEPMSLLGDIAKIAGPIVGGYFGGPIGASIGGALASQLNGGSTPAMPGVQVASLGSLPAIGGAVVTTGRAVAAGARLIVSSARYYCARYPTWCISIGGLGVVQGLVQEGKLPVHRRRRARGISAGEFRGFRKVHKVLSGFCAPRMRIRKGKR